MQKRSIWDVQRLFGGYVVVPTNGIVKANGEAVMGAGLALQAAQRYPKLPFALGEAIRQHGNQVCFFFQYKLFTFPTKHDYRKKADLNLILKSAQQLCILASSCELIREEDTFLIPHVGCGKGELPWEGVRPMLALYLRPLIEQHRVQIVDLENTPEESETLEALLMLKGCV